MSSLPLLESPLRPSLTITVATLPVRTLTRYSCAEVERIIPTSPVSFKLATRTVSIRMDVGSSSSQDHDARRSRCTRWSKRSHHVQLARHGSGAFEAHVLAANVVAHRPIYPCSQSSRNSTAVCLGQSLARPKLPKCDAERNGVRRICRASAVCQGACQQKERKGRGQQVVKEPDRYRCGGVRGLTP